MTTQQEIRVLTVDDSRTIQIMLRKALEEAGYNVIQGCDGVEGLEKLQEVAPPRQRLLLQTLICHVLMALALLKPCVSKKPISIFLFWY